MTDSRSIFRAPTWTGIDEAELFELKTPLKSPGKNGICRIVLLMRRFERCPLSAPALSA